ncbi:hypothetical protein M433DRAFT_149066 [Acidomyces richmondensis BFW]|nr:MAG: hypothetical protein FE78DRAFT_85910 [Acidomyces sp. 'richmondensis']KYG50313.1 hypothetical protein M433DRAFT_149066 [Acidomyces richmondensis BFW]
MQKVIRRAERAHRAAARKLAKKSEHYERSKAWERHEQIKRFQKTANQNIREARKNRHLDWEAGPLAPRRDVGDQVTTYGAMSLWEFQLPDTHPKDRPKFFPFSEGDRVVVIRGRDMGKIGEVTDISIEKSSVTIKGMNKVDIHVPKWVQVEHDMTTDVAAQERSVLIQDVRLVYPLPDPETGIPRDVIIDRLIQINSTYDKIKKKWTEGDRVIPGTNIIIPWPEKPEETFEDHEDDTLRRSVDEQTFRPYLLQAPMPLTVIDELRNKYSKFRTRHDFDYIEKKTLEEEKMESRKELLSSMRTPLQELADIRKKQNEANRKNLTDDQLAKIGEVIARERAKAVGAVKQTPLEIQ